MYALESLEARRFLSTAPVESPLASTYELATEDLSKPATPSSLTPTAISSTEIKVTWKDVSNEDGYQVQWRKTGSSSWSSKTLGKNDTSETIGSLKPATSYDVRLRAGNKASGWSSWTSIKTAKTLAAPAPEPTITDLRATYDLSTGAVVISYSYPGSGTYTLYVDGVATSITDTNGDIKTTQPSGTVRGYKVFGNGAFSNEYTLITGATPGEEPPPPPPPPDPEPSDKPIVKVGPGLAMDSLADIEAKQQPNTIYLLDGLQFDYSDSCGLKLTAEGAEVHGQPGTIINHSGDGRTYEYAAGIEVCGVGEVVKGIEFRGPRKVRGVEVKSGSRDTTITQCTATVDGSGKARLGQFVEVERGVNVTISDNDIAATRRYDVWVSHCDGLKIARNHFGESQGGSDFPGEHNVRCYDTHNAEITDNVMRESDKSSINVRQGSDILVARNDCNNVTIGPLMDGNGDPGDATMRVDRIEVRDNKIRGEVALEMGVHDLNFHHNEIWDSGTAIIVRYQSAYASRGCAKGIVSDNTVHADAIIKAESGGTLSGLEITRNVLA